MTHLRYFNVISYIFSPGQRQVGHIFINYSLKYNLTVVVLQQIFVKDNFDMCHNSFI